MFCLEAADKGVTNTTSLGSSPEASWKAAAAAAPVVQVIQGQVTQGQLTTCKPRTGDARTRDPRTGDPKARKPRTGDPRTGEPRTGDPRRVNTQTGDKDSWAYSNS